MSVAIASTHQASAPSMNCQAFGSNHRPCIYEQKVRCMGKQIEEAFGGSYGIYGGKPKHKAVLRFSIHASRWVANEEWHPDQVGEFDADGRYILKTPYADPTELIMDILRQGHHVEVLEPAELHREIQKEAGLMMAAYK